MNYSQKRKNEVIRKMMPPSGKSIPEISDEEGISTATLYFWRKQARQAGLLLPAGSNNPEGWSSRDKFMAVVETTTLTEAELSEYCRKKGIYPEQVSQWREACEQANDWDRNSNKKLESAVKQERAKSRSLEKELNRKEKALAETAALLTLRKKADAIWGPDGEE